MGAILSSEVKFNPVTVNKVSKCGEGDNATLSPVKIKGYSIRFDVSFKGVLELFKGNRSGVVTVGCFRLHFAHRAGRREYGAHTSKYWKATK